MLLDITLSAMCSRAKYRLDVAPVIDELRATAGDRTDILERVAGSWAGYYERDATPELIVALLTIDGQRRECRSGESGRVLPRTAPRFRAPRPRIVDLNIAALVVPITAWALGSLIGLIILYWVIRLAITGALRSHDDYRAREGRG